MKKMVFVLMVFTFIPLKAFADDTPKVKLTQAECFTLEQKLSHLNDGSVGGKYISNHELKRMKKNRASDQEKNEAIVYEQTLLLQERAILNVRSQGGCGAYDASVEKLISQEKKKVLMSKPDYLKMLWSETEE